MTMVKINIFNITKKKNYTPLYLLYEITEIILIKVITAQSVN